MPYDVSDVGYHLRFGTRDREPTLSGDVADIVQRALHHHHGQTVHLLAYAVMPDHVHAVLFFLEDGIELARWVGDLKRWVAREAARSGSSVRWQTGFYEHRIRLGEDISKLLDYVLNNPVRAGHVGEWPEWPWAGAPTFEA